MTDSRDSADSDREGWTNASLAHHAAATEYVNSRNAYEDAVQSGDADKRATANERMNAAARVYQSTLSDLVKERRAAVPPFVLIAADPTQQLDGNSEVLASIEAHRNAKPATAGSS